MGDIERCSFFGDMLALVHSEDEDNKLNEDVGADHSGGFVRWEDTEGVR